MLNLSNEKMIKVQRNKKNELATGCVILHNLMKQLMTVLCIEITLKKVAMN